MQQMENVWAKGAAMASSTRVCIDCQVEKPVTDFYKQHTRTSYQSYCKMCYKVRAAQNQRQRQEADPEGQRAKHRVSDARYRQKHREEIRLRQRARRAAKREDSTV